VADEGITEEEEWFAKMDEACEEAADIAVLAETEGENNEELPGGRGGMKPGNNGVAAPGENPGMAPNAEGNAYGKKKGEEYIAASADSSEFSREKSSRDDDAIGVFVSSMKLSDFPRDGDWKDESLRWELALRDSRCGAFPASSERPLWDEGVGELRRGGFDVREGMTRGVLEGVV